MIQYEVQYGILQYGMVLYDMNYMLPWDSNGESNQVIVLCGMVLYCFV